MQTLPNFSALLVTCSPTERSHPCALPADPLLSCEEKAELASSGTEIDDDRLNHPLPSFGISTFLVHDRIFPSAAVNCQSATAVVFAKWRLKDFWQVSHSISATLK